MMRTRTIAWTLAACLAQAAAAAAQTGGGQAPSGPFFGSVPRGTATGAPLALSMADALDRALEANLGLLLQEEASRAARGTRWRALADLLPRVSGTMSERRQVINLEAFGFPAPEPIVGPFNVFDLRVGVSQPVVDLSALYATRAAAANERAAQAGVKSARELVVLVAVNLYLEAITASGRVDAARAQLETAAAVKRQASDLKAAGLVAGVDVLRADVQVQQAEQRRIQADNALQKALLRLGRAIGLPPGQAITLTDTMPYAPMAGVPLEQALADAAAHRPDLAGAKERLASAESTARAATAEYLPTLRVDADYGTIGQTVASTHPTYALAATVRVPLFEGGRTQARRLEANAVVAQRKAELEDLRARVDLDVREAYLDLAAAAQQVDTAETTVRLTAAQLTQARDRFAAGVAGSLEVTQAQEAAALAADVRLDALYRHNLAKAALARAVGTAEQAVRAVLGGTK